MIFRGAAVCRQGIEVLCQKNLCNGDLSESIGLIRMIGADMVFESRCPRLLRSALPGFGHGPKHRGTVWTSGMEEPQKSQEIVYKS